MMFPLIDKSYSFTESKVVKLPIYTPPIIESLVKCSVCGGLFPKNQIKHNKCIACYNYCQDVKAGKVILENNSGSKRIHFKIPTFKKVYSVYQYDRKKYGKIYKRVHDLAVKYGKHIFDNAKAYKVIDLCAVKKNGKRVHLGNEKHVYRYSQYELISEQLADIVINRYNLDLTEANLNYIANKIHLCIYVDDEMQDKPQAELQEVWNLPIQQRIKYAIGLIKLLKDDDFSDCELEEIIELFYWQYKEIDKNNNSDSTPRIL